MSNSNVSDPETPPSVTATEDPHSQTLDNAPIQAPAIKTYDPSKPVDDDPWLERARQQLIGLKMDGIERPNHESNVGARDKIHIEPNFDPNDQGLLNRLAYGSDLPRIPGQNFVLFRFTDEPHPETNLPLMSVVGVFSTEQSAYQYMSNLEKASKGIPVNYIVGDMYRMLVLPPLDKYTETLESPDANYTNLIQGALNRRKEATVDFVQRAKRGGVDVSKQEKEYGIAQVDSGVVEKTPLETDAA